MTEKMDVIILDHYDSFTHNLVSLISEAEDADGKRFVRKPPEVIKHDQTSIEELRGKNPDAIVISPGPGHPENKSDIETTDEVLEGLTPEIPTLGVCLGLEAAVHVYGGKVGKTTPIHGKSSDISHEREGCLKGIRQGFKAGRYHSLISEEVPEEMEVTATTTAENGEELVMAARHREYPFEGVQFHPESILTLGKTGEGKSAGEKIISNFLEEAQNFR